MTWHWAPFSSDETTNILSVPYSHWDIVAFGPVKDLAGTYPAAQFLQKQLLLLLDLLQDALVLVSTPRKIWEYFIYRPIWDVLVGRVS